MQRPGEMDKIFFQRKKKVKQVTSVIYFILFYFWVGEDAFDRKERDNKKLKSEIILIIKHI